MYRIISAFTGLALFAAVGVVALVANAQAPTCDRNATPSSLAAEISAATTGQTVCLAAGSYGTWAGTNKQITLRPQSGATATMGLNLNTGDQGFTLDGLRLTGGDLLNGAKDITIRNAVFTAALRIDGLANANVLLEGNQHLNINAPSGSTPARIHLSYSGAQPSGVTVRNSLFQGGDADGIQAGTALTIEDNTFRDILESGPNHTDSIQMYGATDMVIRRNFITHSSTGIVAYDGTSGNVIEDNVIDLLGERAFGIELYSDDASVVRHNTLRRGSCPFNLPCGIIALDRKSADDAGRNTVVVDNVAQSIDINNGSSAAQNHHNLVAVGSGQIIGTPMFVGPLTEYTGFRLAPGSPGRAAASDGSDVGVRFAAPPVPTPTPTPSPTPTPTPDPGYHPDCEPTCDEQIATLMSQRDAAVDAQHAAEAARDTAIAERDQERAARELAERERDEAQAALEDARAAWQALREALE